MNRSVRAEWLYCSCCCDVSEKSRTMTQVVIALRPCVAVTSRLLFIHLFCLVRYEPKCVQCEKITPCTHNGYWQTSNIETHLRKHFLAIPTTTNSSIDRELNSILEIDKDLNEATMDLVENTEKWKSEVVCVCVSVWWFDSLTVFAAFAFSKYKLVHWLAS